MEKTMIRISVRNLVEFILRSGDIDNRRSMSPENAMLEGSRIHRMIQRRMGSNYQAEVVLRLVVECGEYDISVEGRADGILTERDYPKAEQIEFNPIGNDLIETGASETKIEIIDIITVDEIKGTYMDIHRIKEPAIVHLAQAKVYAYIYALQHNLPLVRVRMTYCHLETEELKYFYEEYTFTELRIWFQELTEQYRKWADFEFQWKVLRQEAIQVLEFPFPYREGQKDLATYVYQTIYHSKKLFTVAPTGVGKTISTIFPSIKAMGKGMGDKLFYLTAKTITRTVADDTFELLRKRGLQFKSVILTAKEKICPLEETECNPLSCLYARGHYDRINDAVFALLLHEDRYTRETIEEYAQKYKVCPFEMSLDMSLFSDAVICDYNYVFDPHAYLKRFFSDGINGNYLFLIDEAHNLLDRGREMYSAVLRKEDFLNLKKLVKPIDNKMEKQLEKCNKELLHLKRECEFFQVVEHIDSFTMAAGRLHTTMDKFLQEHDDSEIKSEILDLYFQLAHFLDIYERMDDNYVSYTELQSDGSFILKLFCVNPSVNLKERMAKGRSTILFSATLLPIQYYKGLLGGDNEDYEVYAQSTFDSRKRALFIGSDVTSKYSRRTDMEFMNIAAYIDEIIKNRNGNYLLFFPSHSFLQQVYDTFFTYFYDETKVECIIQSDHMNEKAREDFLKRFHGNEQCDLEQIIQIDIEVEEEKSLLGFCVMGGIFSEGIDLTEDKLIGAIIVGTGLPQVCNERELIKGYFDEKQENGFDYAYRYPGMNKVLQAAGRVIRTSKDVGIIALLDERFLNRSYQQLFPREWEEFEVVTRDKIAKRIERFWNEWL